MKNKVIDKEFLKYKMNDKDFDCVKMMRDIRTKLFNKYKSNPSSFKRDMENMKKSFNK